jgi:catechol 2,3-dioxygenase-like lactoylglutathione lyase family enzyme
MTPVALWLPFEVDDLDRAESFYTDRIGLSVVDGWNRDGERGVVLGAGSAYVELVSPGRPGPAPLAFQFARASDVDSIGRRIGGMPRRYPRGHYGFETDGPDRHARIMVWSERS